MQRTTKHTGALLIAGMLALAGCQGEKGPQGDAGAPGPGGAEGPQGPAGPAGQDGQDLTAKLQPEACAGCHRQGTGAAHQAIYDQYTDASVLAATIDSVASVARVAEAGTFDVTVTFSITKNGVAYDGDVTKFAQKTVYVTKYDPATKDFTPTTSLSRLARVAGTTNQWTAKNSNVEPTTAGADRTNFAFFAPESSDAIVYAYFAENPTLIPAAGSYRLYDNVASVARTFGTVDYTSAANVSNCERCHGAPYMKHGYRAGDVAGLPGMAACKTCHYDTRKGGHQDWQCLVDDPAAYAADTCEAKAEWDDYAYKATVMNDTHMSHAMEFAYPQSMANCVTCHEGKLGTILGSAKFTLETCKSCHPVTGPAGGTDPKRAPALASIIPPATHPFVANGGLYAYTGACNGCHSGATAGIPTLAEIHPGFDGAIYASEGVKHSSAIATSIGAVSYNKTTRVLTIPFTVSGTAATAIVKPTVVVSLYGYDTKDFVVSGHGSAADGNRNLEWAEGATRNSTRLTVNPATAAAGNTSWTATADLTTWAAKLDAGVIKRAEIAILPALGKDQTIAPQKDPTKANYNPYLAIKGAARTFDLVNGTTGTLVADAASYGKAIVDASKCDKCHDALGTTFHDPAYGSAGVVACRTCHVGLSGGSHLEMQSRSIDSYVHAIHSFQAFDVGDVDFTDPVAELEYEHHVASTYPNFTILNCESCHNAGAYEVPDQARSMPGVLSAADTVAGRNIGAMPSTVTGAASRACGSCHRARLINADDAGGLEVFNEHTSKFGFLLDASIVTIDTAIEKVMALFK